MKKLTLPVTYCQNDPRWKNSPMGTKGTIGGVGCLLNCATMSVSYYGFKETPLTLNEKMTQNGGYQDGNLLIWGAIPKLFAGLKYSGKWSNSQALTQDQMNQIRGAIDKGFPVFLQIDTIPSTSAFDEHWILAIGYDGDDFIVQDPWDGAEKRITSWGVTAQKLIYSWCWYEGTPAAIDAAEGCLVPNTPEWRTKYEQIVASATKWAETLKILEITDDPNTTPSDKVKSVAAGYKSRETDLKNQLGEKQKDLDVANTEITNRTEQVSRLEKLVLEKEKYYKDLLDALKKDIKNLPEIVKVAEGRVKVLEGELDEANKAKGRALLEAQTAKSQLEACQKGQLPVKTSIINAVITALTNFIKNLINRKEVKKA
ncbi:MAG: C39 family peptidase [Candidatus Daviesbacteria bacterium]|nr:C39 family peptidase [Candidatus Daviesbacteria bacterium]